MKTKILFVCTNNVDRSKTAEDMYKNDPRFEVRSAGVALTASTPVTRDLVSWADVIVVMDEKRDRHAFKLYQMFPFLEPMGKRIEVLDIEDKFTRGDPQLMSRIEEKMKKIFG